MADLTGELLERYFAERWGEPTKVLNLERFARGISRQTWFIEAQRASAAQPDRLILRRDLEGNSIGPGPLRFEHDVYARLQNSGVPVAEVLWWEDSDRWAEGRPFYLRRQVEGTWNVPNYTDPDPKFDRLRVETGREHVRALAMVHSRDWRALGFHELLPTPAHEADCAPVAIKRMYDDLKRFQFEPLPVLIEIREWLLDQAPTAPRICLLKGTNGLGEEVFHEGKIVAMSDWEQASLGDPASDFARTQDFLQEVIVEGEKVWGLEQALDYYEEVSGVRVPLASVGYYRVLTMVENVISLHHGALPVVTRADLSARLSWLAIEAAHHGQRMMMAHVNGRAPTPAREIA